MMRRGTSGPMPGRAGCHSGPRRMPPGRRPQPALAGVPAYRLISPRLRGLSVGGQEQPGRFPLRPPLLLGQARGGQVAPRAQQGLPAPHHRHRPRLQPPLCPGQPGPQGLQADRLSVPLGRGGVPADPAIPAARRDGQPCLDYRDPRAQGRRLRPQVPLRELPLVLTRAGDRTRPPRRGGRRQRPLPRRPGHGPACRAQPALRAPGGQVTPGQHAQMRPGGPQHAVIGGRDRQPGPDPGPGRGSRHERGGDLPKPPHPAPPFSISCSIPGTQQDY